VSQPPEAQVATYAAAARSWGAEDQKKMIRVCEEHKEKDLQEGDPLRQRLARLPPFPALAPASISRRWGPSRSHPSSPAAGIEGFSPAPVVEMLARLQTYGLKRCHVAADGQARVLAAMQAADQSLTCLHTRLLAKEDILRRTQLRLAEVPRLQEATDTAVGLIADIARLLDEIHARLPDSVRQQLQGTAGVPFATPVPIPATHPTP